MEHDEMCELPNIVRAFGNKGVVFSQVEIGLLRDDAVGRFCFCRRRADEPGVPHLITLAEDVECARRAFQSILTARQAQASLMSMPKVGDRFTVEIEVEDRDRVIRVDFRNRRRVN